MTASTVNIHPTDGWRWHVPDDARRLRILIACVEPGTPIGSVTDATGAAHSSVLVLAPVPRDAAAALADAVCRLAGDGCPMDDLALIGIGRMAGAPLAACLLLRLAGQPLPAVVAGAAAPPVLLRPSATSTEMLVAELSSIATAGPAGSGWRGVESASAAIDRVLAASSS